MLRDDGLACFENIGRLRAERIRKYVIDIFKSEFQIIISNKTNLKVANFLDVTFNLTTGKYQPYSKPDNYPLYIDVNANHLPNII